MVIYWYHAIEGLNEDWNGTGKVRQRGAIAIPEKFIEALGVKAGGGLIVALRTGNCGYIRIAMLSSGYRKSPGDFNWVTVS